MYQELVNRWHLSSLILTDLWNWEEWNSLLKCHTESEATIGAQIWFKAPQLIYTIFFLLVIKTHNTKARGYTEKFLVKSSKETNQQVVGIVA